MKNIDKSTKMKNARTENGGGYMHDDVAEGQFQEN
jgi:hypothetical protein